MDLAIVILAAGQGTRMGSSLPKVLHPLGNGPMLSHTINTAKTLTKLPITVVCGHAHEQVMAAFPDKNIVWVHQKEQLGTGHALKEALPAIKDSDRVLVLYGDVPLITPNTLQNLIDSTPKQGVGVLTAHFDHPHGLGRIVRSPNGAFEAIVEEKDATEAQKAITEINTGLYCLPTAPLTKWLGALSNNNSQKEYYLTDVCSLALKENIPVVTVTCPSQKEVMGVNTMMQLAILERHFQRETANRLMHQGVRFANPSHFECRGSCEVGKDSFIDTNVIIEGNTVIGNRCSIGPNVILKNATIKDDVTILANTMIEDSTVEQHASIGPFARIRPGSICGENTKIGNFVEIKKSSIGQGTKIGHLSYIGDSKVGKNTNIGAGAITCNYDGYEKHTTIIGDNAFIGSNTQLIAPVKIGNGATIGAGSTITEDAPPRKLTLSRSRQVTFDGWKRPKKSQKTKEDKSCAES